MAVLHPFLSSTGPIPTKKGPGFVIPALWNQSCFIASAQSNNLTQASGKKGKKKKAKKQSRRGRDDPDSGGAQGIGGDGLHLHSLHNRKPGTEIFRPR
jgi:hypothetical protein